MLLILIIVICLAIFSAMIINRTKPESLTTIINNTQKVTGETTHNKKVHFADKVDVLKYDTTNGKNLSMTRENTNGESNKKFKESIIQTSIINALHNTMIGAAETSTEEIGIAEIITGAVLI